MKASEAFRINYQENIHSNKGPFPPGYARGYGFEPDMFWMMGEFVKPAGLDFLRQKAEQWLDGASLRKDFQMAQSDYSPRNMRVVPGTVINQDASLMDLYRDQELIAFLSDTIGMEVEVYPDPLENVVMTSLEGVGDTHGRHVDVPPLALIVCLEAPETYDKDASVEVMDQDGDVWMGIRGTDTLAGKLSFTNAHGDQQVVAMDPGDAYILRSDLLPHEVLPLIQGMTKRVILNLTYGIKGIQNEPDGSVEELFM